METSEIFGKKTCENRAAGKKQIACINKFQPVRVGLRGQNQSVLANSAVEAKTEQGNEHGKIRDFAPKKLTGENRAAAKKQIVCINKFQPVRVGVNQSCGEKSDRFGKQGCRGLKPLGMNRNHRTIHSTARLDTRQQ